MNITVKNVSAVIKELVIELPKERVDEEIAKALRDAKSVAHTSVKGFRPGRVPKTIVENRFGKAIEAEVAHKLIDDSYPKAAEREAIQAVAQAHVEEYHLHRGEPFRYTVRVEVRPSVEPAGYLGLEVERPKVEIPTEIVDRELERLRLGQAQLKAIEDRTRAEKADLATVDFVGRIDGRVFRDGRATDYQLELGSGRYLDELELGVVGMNVGETKEIDVPFPEGSPNPEIAGKKAIFKVTLKALHEKLVPKLDDDFAKELGSTSLDELKTKVRERIEGSARESALRVARQNAVDQVVQKNSFEVPPSLIERQLDIMMEEARNMFRRSGVRPEQVLDPAKLREEMRMRAANHVRAAFLVDAIGKREGVQAGDSDVEERLQRIVRAAGPQGPDARRYWEEEENWDHLKAQVREEKTIDLILSHATIREVERKPGDVDDADESPTDESPEATPSAIVAP